MVILSTFLRRLRSIASGGATLLVLASLISAAPAIAQGVHHRPVRHHHSHRRVHHRRDRRRDRRIHRRHTAPRLRRGHEVDVANPTAVIGNGSPASCTSAAVVAAVAQGGVITFACGPKPVTIAMDATAVIPNTDRLVVLDGGGLVTLSGQGQHEILASDACAGTWSTSNCVNQPYPQLVVQNIAFTNGYSGAQQDMGCTANTPACWYGGVDGGGAIYVEGGQFQAIDSTFTNNRCYGDGPDLGGGAIRALAQYDDLPVDLTNDTFTGNSCSNGGALSSISVNWDISNSTFSDNTAVGWGANPAAAGTPGGGSGGAIYMDGVNTALTLNGSTMAGNRAAEGGGAIFDVADYGTGTMTFNGSVLSANPSGQFQNAPGIFFEVDSTLQAPAMLASTDG